MSQSKNILGTMPMGRLIFTMSGPIMLSMLMQAVYNLVDSIYVARLGDNAFLALSYAYPIQTLLIAFCVGTGVAFSATLSQRLGARQMDQASAVVLHGGSFYFGCWLLFFLFGLLGADAYLRACTDTPSVITQGAAYLRVCCCLSFGVCTQFPCERILQSSGRPAGFMIIQGSGALINIILDPILIFGLFGFPRMEVAGAALATVIGQICGALLALMFNLRKNTDVHFQLKNLRPSASIIGGIYSVGVPSIAMQSIGSVMVFGMNKILISFTEAATAVFGAYFKLQSFIFMPIFGLNNAMVPIISYNYGAGKPERFRRTIRLSAVTAIAIMCVGLALFEIIPGTLLGLFSPSEEMLTIGRTALRIIGLTFPLAGFCIVSGSVFQALGTPFYSLIVSVCRQICVLLPVAYLLSLTGRLELVWWSFPIAELVSLTLSAIFLRRTLRAAGERLSQK